MVNYFSVSGCLTVWYREIRADTAVVRVALVAQGIEWSTPPEGARGRSHRRGARGRSHPPRHPQATAGNGRRGGRWRHGRRGACPGTAPARARRRPGTAPPMRAATAGAAHREPPPGGRPPRAAAGGPPAASRREPPPRGPAAGGPPAHSVPGGAVQCPDTGYSQIAVTYSNQNMTQK